MKDPSAIVETLTPIEVGRYSHLNHDSLLCYAVKELESLAVPVTFENITVAAFRLFPKTFSLVGYLNYPDASRVNRTLLHARPKYRDLIVGNAKSGYALTAKGRRPRSRSRWSFRATHRRLAARFPPHPTRSEPTRDNRRSGALRQAPSTSAGETASLRPLATTNCGTSWRPCPIRTNVCSGRS